MRNAQVQNALQVLNFRDLLPMLLEHPEYVESIPDRRRRIVEAPNRIKRQPTKKAVVPGAHMPSILLENGEPRFSFHQCIRQIATHLASKD
jgi:hypothetical protein